MGGIEVMRVRQAWSMSMPVLYSERAPSPSCSGSDVAGGNGYVQVERENLKVEGAGGKGCGVGFEEWMSEG